MFRKFCFAVACSLLGGFLALGHRSLAAEPYDPAIDPAAFTTKIDNPYFSIPIGKKMFYEEPTKGGLERTEITITGEKRTIMGVETLVYHDRVYFNDALIEDTKDYIAQDRDGNVWYFGEDVSNYEDGKLKDHHGAWIAGVDGAKPGIWFKARHSVGDTYRQEYYRGEAEDLATIVATSVTVTTKARTYKNCIKTLDWTPLDAKSVEYKFYCSEVGTTVVKENVTTGERAELVKVENGR